MLKIISLTTNYLKNPSGIIGIPQIGWAIESDKSCTVQTCYHLTIADSSGKVIEKGRYFGGKKHPLPLGNDSNVKTINNP